MATPLIAVTLVALSLLAFAVFGWDKFCATRGRRRVSERTLLGLMAVGGSPGGWAAMFAFHHKTQKASFRTAATIIVALQIVALIAIWVWRAAR
jgi:uncharacterized membrane protein YsdA (DUF1294 family)